jgi:hypothetical protein
VRLSVLQGKVIALTCWTKLAYKYPAAIDIDSYLVANSFVFMEGNLAVRAYHALLQLCKPLAVR